MPKSIRHPNCMLFNWTNRSLNVIWQAIRVMSPNIIFIDKTCWNLQAPFVDDLHIGAGAGRGSKTPAKVSLEQTALSTPTSLPHCLGCMQALPPRRRHDVAKLLECAGPPALLGSARESVSMVL